MWSSPGLLNADQEFALNSVSISSLLSQIAHGDATVSMPITHQLASNLLRDFRALRNRLHRLDVQLHCARVHGADKHVIQALASLNARTVSWSNCLDYILDANSLVKAVLLKLVDPGFFVQWLPNAAHGQVGVFHGLAKAIGLNALHFGYSMQWMPNGLLLRYELFRLARNGRLEQFLLDNHLRVLVDWQSLLHNGEILDNSVFDYFLRLQSYEDHEFLGALRGCGAYVGDVSMDLWNPLQFGVNTCAVHMTWSYTIQDSLSSAEPYNISRQFKRLRSALAARAND